MNENKVAELAVSSLLTVVSILGSIFFGVYGLIRAAGTGPEKRAYRPFLTILGVFLVVFSAQAIIGWFALDGCTWCGTLVRQTVPWSLGIMALVVVFLVGTEWMK
jgi:hypothetical protein